MFDRNHAHHHSHTHAPRVTGNGMETELEMVQPVLHLRNGAAITLKSHEHACFDMIGRCHDNFRSKYDRSSVDPIVHDRPVPPFPGNGNSGKRSVSDRFPQPCIHPTPAQQQNLSTGPSPPLTNTGATGSSKTPSRHSATPSPQQALMSQQTLMAQPMMAPPPTHLA